LNAKNYGVPQNRERVFIVGIRDDQDNDFKFPKAFPLTKKLKDILESEVEEKYYLSDKMIGGLFLNPSGKKNSFPAAKTKNGKDYSACLTSRMAKMGRADNYISVNKVGFINQDTQASQVFSEKGISPSICAGTHGYANGNIDKPIIAHNLSGGKWDKTHEQNRRVYDVEGIAPAMLTCGGGNKEPKIVAMRGRNPENTSDRTAGCPTIQMLEENKQGISNALTTVQKDNYLIIPEKTKKGYAIANNGDSFYLDRPHQKRGVVQKEMTSTIKTSGNDLGVVVNQNSELRIRKLTPTECFRLMDFPDSLVENARNVGVSNSQLYKQAGNSIVVGVLALIIKNLKL
jgi:DNA (cytosine-5)-methyltransferase 1